MEKETFLQYMVDHKKDGVLFLRCTTHHVPLGGCLQSRVTIQTETRTREDRRGIRKEVNVEPVKNELVVVVRLIFDKQQKGVFHLKECLKTLCVTGVSDPNRNTGNDSGEVGRKKEEENVW